MKITKGRLQQIIQEELSYVLMESAEDMYVVRVTSSSPFSGAVTSYWPSNDKPFVGSKAAAEEQVMKAKEGRFSRDWRVVKLDLGSMRADDPMRAPLADAVKERAHSADNDLDTDNDGMISAGELEKELEDIKDDLDTVDIVDVETGEVLYIGAGTQRGIPAAKVDDFIRDLKLSVRGDDKDGTERSIELSKTDFEKLEDHIDKVYDRPEREKAAASRKADQERLDPRRLKDELSRRAKIAGEEYMADNPDGNLDDVALDLGMAVLYSFERDEQEELLYAFDDDEYQLSLYAAESM